MTLRDQFEKETGKNVQTGKKTLPCEFYLPDYVQWLEAKLQKPEVSEDARLYSLDELEETFNAGREYFVDDYSWSFEDWLKELNQ